MAVKFFDEAWYLSRNPDVAEAVSSGSITAQQHFEMYGMNEGRSPSALFDAAFYLEKNPDVAAAVQEGLTTAYGHFQSAGHTEERTASPFFNVDYYFESNPDLKEPVEAWDISLHEHFYAHGQFEGRSPLSSFNAAHYLAANPDVDAEVKGDLGLATVHFMRYGVAEDRNLNAVISIGAYLAANEDVLQAVEQGQISGLAHLLTYGMEEGRPLGNGISPAQFVNDPVYQQAVASGDTDAALARMAQVAPFLPEFVAPEGFQLPPDWTYPEDFVPVPGSELTPPDGWEPVDPVEPPVTPPDTPADALPVQVAPDGTVTLPDVIGEITLANNNGKGAFEQGERVGEREIALDNSSTVQLSAEQVLVGSFTDIGLLGSVVGDGAVRALGSDAGDTIDASEWNVVNLTVEGGTGNDKITIADGQTAVGGEGSDTFVISAEVGSPSVITVDDYNFEEGDVIDLTAVQGVDISNILDMEVRGAEHTGSGWDWEDYAGDSVGIWFSGDAANVQLTGARGETMKFAIPDVPGFEAYDVLQVNIAPLGDLRANNDAPEILVGGDGSQFFHAGTQADIMMGGAGHDIFIVGEAAHSNLANMDRIVDFTIGEDILVSHTLVLEGDFYDAGRVANLDASTIGAALTAENFGANEGAHFTIGEGAGARTYVALNDGAAGYDATADTLIDITGYSGDLASLAVIGVPDLGSLTDELAAA